MNVTFHIEYHTRWGQELFLSGSSPALGGGDESRAVPMRCTSAGEWTLEQEIPASGFPLAYRYIVRENGALIDREWGGPHRLHPDAAAARCAVFDSWSARPADTAFYASAFVDGIFSRRSGTPTLVGTCRDMSGNPALGGTCRDTSGTPTPVGTCRDTSGSLAPGTLTLSVEAPTIQPQEVLAVVDSLSGWDPSRARRLDDAGFPVWTLSQPLDRWPLHTEYKFVVLRRSDGGLVEWEEGSNRRVGDLPSAGDTAVVVRGLRLRRALSGWKGAGVALPVFSLRTESSFGIGDFVDLRRLVDWAAAAGLRLIQILPVNDTTMTHTWSDSYPYNANSIFALHPAYLRLEEAGRLSDARSRRRFAALQKRLNALPDVDYEQAVQAKEAYVAELFREQGAETLAGESYRTFFEANRSWLVPYAAFCYLRDRYATPDYTRWPGYDRYDPALAETFFTPGHPAWEAVSRTCFVQYHLDRQLRATRDYAHRKGVVLKGDIPIGISRHSVDAWTHAPLFHLDSQAGAPPDAFAVQGQNWGFPTYNWPEMEKDGYAWWKARFRKMADYFDAYRIDHILGFFRIWQIPCSSVQGVMGHFNPALPLTPEEIRSFGFPFEPQRHARPLLSVPMLAPLFGEYASEAVRRYLQPVSDGSCTLRPEVGTQRKIEQALARLRNRDKREILRNGLFTLAANVLFLEDPAAGNRWHPRIDAQRTAAYQALPDEEKRAFDRLYEDFFYHRHNEFWKQEALKKLPPLIASTRMLVCGEDLGMIPACVPDVMDTLQILSLEIQRMPKTFGSTFADTRTYPRLSVCATSTHDMSPLRAWWEEDKALTQRFYNDVLGLPGEAPDTCTPEIAGHIIGLHLGSPSMWAVLPLQDWLAQDAALRRPDCRAERINEPANPRHYWRYRMHLTVEQLLDDTGFTRRLRQQIETFHR